MYVFYNFNATSIGNTFEIPFNCQFPVKEVKISCGFTGYSQYFTTMYATMSGLFPSGDIIQVFTGGVGFDNTPDFLYSGNMNNGAVSYLFREPQIINGTYTMRLSSIDAIGARFQLMGVMHFELLG